MNFFARHGLRVEKVHKIITFRQNEWLEKYIKLNTQNFNTQVILKRTSIFYSTTHFVETQWKLLEKIY